MMVGEWISQFDTTIAEAKFCPEIDEGMQWKLIVGRSGRMWDRYGIMLEAAWKIKQ